MVLLVVYLFGMPPNPFISARAPITEPRYPRLMNAGIERLEKPVGERRAVVILIDFNDNQHMYASENFDSLVYSESGRSMRDYYTEVTYGMFTISRQSEVTEWVRAPYDYSFYIGDSFGLYPGTFPANVQGIVYAACSLADPYVNFADYDEDDDGEVDAVFIVHAGPGAEETGYIGWVWSHQWQLSNTGTGCPGAYMTDDGVRIDHYSMEPERFDSLDRFITVGVFCHEYGHILGLPDLYDYDGSSSGLGMFAMMAAGSWGNANGQEFLGASPVHFCAWSKYQLGWVSPIAVERIGVSRLDDQTIPCAAFSPIAFRLLEDPGGPDWEFYTGIGEYFLVENRYQTGYDRSLPGNGLLILHADDARSDNDNEDHPLVGIMQADGDGDFLLDYGDLGRAEDLWKNSEYGFGDTSRPASLDYDGNPTGVWVYDIGPADSSMNASFWVTPVLLGTVYGFPNPFRADDPPSWGQKVIFTYVPTDTVDLGDPNPYFTVAVYNVAGERVRVLDDEPLEVDRYTRRAFWDLKNDNNDEVVSGMYLFVIETQGDKTERRKGRLTVIR
jgi:immune inhibitor A